MEKISTILIIFAVLSAWAERQPYSRYESIVERQMFGPLPANFDPTKSPSEVAAGRSSEEKQLSQEQEKLKSSIRFSMINITPEGATAVGFTDNTDPKVPVPYYLKVGEQRNGWLVKEADAQTATMTIAKGEIEVTLTIGGDSAKGAGTTARAGARNAPAERPASFAGRGLLGGAGSLRSRRMLRQQEELKNREAEESRRKEAEARAAEEKAQHEAEREESRKQLMAIQEELKKQREEREKEKKEESAKEKESGENENNDAE